MNNYSGPERRMEDPWRTNMEGRVSAIEGDLRGMFWVEIADSAGATEVSP